jgi:hypothetical protein
MTHTELALDSETKTIIQKFVQSNRYFEIKDAFISGSPTGEMAAKEMKTDDMLVLSHGEITGLIKMFRKMEEIAKFVKPTAETKRKEGSIDPDLET